MDNRGAIRSGYIFWLDTVKGLGVYLVVLGHLWYQSNLPVVNKGIYSFHMPLFFIVAGIALMSCCMPVCNFVNEHLPVLNGRRKVSK